jgi:hypothetical protein
VPNPSKLDSRRNYSIEFMPLEDIFPLSINTAAVALPEDEIICRYAFQDL